MKEYYRIDFYLERLKKSRKIVAFLLTLSFLAVLMSCATEMTSGVRVLFDELDKNIREYNDLLRSNQLDKARLYATESLWEGFDTRAKAVKIINYRILSRDVEEGKGAETVKVEIDYSIPPSNVVKTVLDNQQWSYVYSKKEGKKNWLLMTPLPEFK
jgi:hypothetical protein